MISTRFIMRLHLYITDVLLFIAFLTMSIASYSYTIPMATDSYGGTQQVQKQSLQKRTQGNVNQSSEKKAKDKSNNQSSGSSNDGLWYNGYTNYKPPKVVLDFLNNPTKQNAVKYLKWQRERTQKLLAAIRVLRQVEKEMYTAKPKHLSDDLLVVFFSPECPHCRSQLAILKNVVKDYPNIDMILYPIDNPPVAKQLLKALGLSKYLVYGNPMVERLNVSNAVPYLVFISKSKERITFSHTGVMNYEEIMGHL